MFPYLSAASYNVEAQKHKVVQLRAQVSSHGVQNLKVLTDVTALCNV